MRLPAHLQLAALSLTLTAAPAVAAATQDAVSSPFTPLHPLALEETPAQLEQPRISVTGDPCDWDKSIPHWQEDSRDFFRSITCHSFRWFDGLFGNSIDYPENEVSGLVRLGAEWDQYYGFDDKLKFRVRAPLPNMSRRFDVMLGRGEDDEFISDTETQDSTFYNPGLVNRSDNNSSWLLGLGHRRSGGRSGWDWSVGMRLRRHPVPYAKLQWYYYRTFGEAADLRFRQTFFWRNDDGWGTTSRGDFAWAMRDEDVLRWEGVITESEVTDGAEWWLGQTWYHFVGDNGAYSLLTFARGETDADVSLTEYGFNLIWRRPITRDWLYLSMGPSLTWPREHAFEKREASWGFGVWLEMEFGEWEWR